jgi:hypothetical protein
MRIKLENILANSVVQEKSEDMNRMNQLAFPVSQPSPYIQSPGPMNPPALGNGTYTSWPGGVDPSVQLYAGNPVPLSMNGGRRASRKNRKASRKNRKASRKNRRAPCGSRKNNRSSRKNNRRSSRKNNRKASRKH